jgi:hypothetical protein
MLGMRALAKLDTLSNAASQHYARSALPGKRGSLREVDFPAGLGVSYARKPRMLHIHHSTSDGASGASALS